MIDLPFIGHHQNWKHLTELVEKNQLASSQLFYGLSGIGKKIFAKTLVQFSFCESLVESPCLKCESCQKVENQTHPDFFYLEPEGKFIKIDQIRKLQKQISRTPLEANSKFVIIDNAQFFNQSSANSLLKTLEEPPAHTYFILISTGIFHVLPTIRSRCHKVFFQSPPLDEILSLLQNKYEDLNEQEIQEGLEMVDSSPGLFSILAQDEFKKSWEMIDGLMQSSQDYASIVNAVSQVSKIDIDFIFLLEMIKKKLISVFKNSDNENLLQKIDMLSRAQMDIKSQVQKNLILENLFLKIFPI